MTENKENKLKLSFHKLVDAYVERLDKPELRQKMVDNELAALDTEKIKRLAEELGEDPDELKELLKKPQ